MKAILHPYTTRMELQELSSPSKEEHALSQPEEFVRVRSNRLAPFITGGGVGIQRNRKKIERDDDREPARQEDDEWAA